MEDEAAEFESVLPFVVVKSKGGTYDDDGYCAGFEVGHTYAVLQLMKPPEWDGTVRTANVPQIDLIAMNFSYKIVDREEHDGGWTTLTITKDESQLGE